MKAPAGTTAWADRHLDDLFLDSWLSAILSGYDTDYEKISWSGSRGGNQLIVTDFFIVKNVTAEELSGKFDYNKIPNKRDWLIMGSTGGTQWLGDYFKGFDYIDDDVHYFFDFIFIQKGKDVHVAILHKGTKK